MVNLTYEIFVTVRVKLKDRMGYNELIMHYVLIQYCDNNGGNN